MNRRAFLKYSASMLSVVAASGGIYYYAHRIEPQSLQVQHEEIHSPLVPAAFHDLKILQISDTHIGFQYTTEQFKQLCYEINRLQADVVVFTGDLIDKPHKFKPNKHIAQALANIQARYGKYWVYGNHDHGGNGTREIKELMDSAQFQLLQNEHLSLRIYNEQIILAGIDDASLGSPNLDEAFQGVNPELFTILLSHAPDYADFAANYPVDVQISGHSHGGQIRLPFIGHLYTPSYAKKYIKGAYNISENLKLYVSKGIGTTRMPFRFLCKPEINVYTLKTQD